MMIGIHPDSYDGNCYAEKWAAALRARGEEVKWLDLLAQDAFLQVDGCQGVMWRWPHDQSHKQSAKQILHVVEQYLGIPVFPDSRTAWHYDEKSAQWYLLRAAGAPMPETWLFWSRPQALAWAETASYPVVFKLSAGAGSTNVQLVRTQAEAVLLINRMFVWGIFPLTLNEFAPRTGLRRTWREWRAAWDRVRHALRYVWKGRYPPLHPQWWKPEFGYAYFQKFLAGNEHDTRVTVIGDRAFGFRRLNRPGDFRASGSGRLDFAPEQVDLRCVEVAFHISKELGFQSMAYDFLYDEGRPVISEVSYTFLDRAVHACPGHWTPELRWVDGSLWPEEAQVEDFLQRVAGVPLQGKRGRGRE